MNQKKKFHLVSKKIRICFFSDKPIESAGFYSEFQKFEDFETVNNSSVNIEAISLIQDLDVDIMIIDGNVSGSKVNDIITRVKQLLPFAKILVFSTFTDNSTIISALKSGASGYILKNETPEIIAKAIKDVIEGNISLSAKLRTVGSKFVFADTESIIGCGFTKREGQVVELLNSGLSNKQIGYALHASERTIEFHISNILRKLNVNSRIEAVLWLKEHGMP